MKKLFICLSIVWNCCFLGAQDLKTVEAKGLGVLRNDALNDALRNAISQAAGVALSSQTTVENYMVISDAIATNTQGYIKSYTILSEKQVGENYEVTVKAEVTTLAIKADFNLLAKGIGGVRFLAMYDPRTVTAAQKPDYDFVLDQVNKYFASKKYRYIDRTRFATLQKETMLLVEDHDTTGVTYAQQLAMLADAQFLVVIKNIRKETVSEQFDTQVKSRVIVDAVTLDNCTGEGLGTISLQGSWQEGNANVNQPGIASALQSDMDILLETFSSYIGGWVNNGTPFEIRFYSSGTYRDLRDLRTKMKADPAFGGELEIVAAGEFTKINCTYKKKADEMADKILDYADQIPTLKDKRLDVKLIYGRQISFAPQGIDIKKTKVSTVLKEHEAKSTPAPEPNTTTPKPDQQTEQSPNPQPPAEVPMASFSIFTEGGEKFWLVVNGAKYNATAAAKVQVDKFPDDVAKIKIIFADSKLKAVDDKLNLFNYITGEVYKNAYVIRKKKDKYVVKMLSASVIGRRFADTNGNGKNDYQEADEPVATSHASQSASAVPTIQTLNCTSVMSDTDFKAALSQISKASLGGGNIKMAANMLNNNCVNLSQAKSLIATSSFDDDKLTLAQMAYVNCTEKNKYYLLSDQFSFSSTRDKFNDFLLQKK